ncbi:haloacid dehalogenase [Acidipropionibacterium jensenii]|uniref:Haloacid dehalogenase n=1 Tax=Acidipropionibacterium jensenii TaxID=1749 RepID=A0A3Q9UL61_9ACTN|nr:HAD-IA family hydrolase [Acidipropionibacterium jensenii]AZZ39920.1 haloacid dehalogenase [Acidipropionibacterium jensenii]
MNTIIWDMGGTLIDTYPEVDRALAEAVWGPHPAAEQIHRVSLLRAESIAHAIDVLATRHGIDRSRLDDAYSALKRRWAIHPAPVMDGAVEVMAAVHAAGGLNLVATHRDRTSAQALLDALGLRPDDMVCAPDGFPRKPSPAMNLLLMRRHHLVAHQVLCVGDRPIDVEAAAAAGLAGALLVPDGEETPVPRLPEGSVVISALTDLLAMIG